MLLYLLDQEINLTLKTYLKWEHNFQSEWMGFTRFHTNIKEMFPWNNQVSLFWPVIPESWSKNEFVSNGWNNFHVKGGGRFISFIAWILLNFGSESARTFSTSHFLHSVDFVKLWKWVSENFFLSEVNNRETIAAIEENNDTYCLQKRIEKFRCSLLISVRKFYFRNCDRNTLTHDFGEHNKQ